MFEAVASKFLMKFLKPYIKDLSSDHMNMELWKGKASFFNLELVSESLIKHNIPISITKGVLCNIDVTFPWKKL